MSLSRPVHYVFAFTAMLITGIGVSCKSYRQQAEELPDNEYRGTIHVSADESFRPVIDEQVRVYESQHPAAKIVVDYKPEALCLQDLFNDSVRMIIVTRKPSADEKELLSDSLKKSAKSHTVALDAIAVIVHPSVPDSMLTMNEVRDILTGKHKKRLIPVFDGVKATSTVRFIIDSVLRGNSLTKEAMAADSSKGVIDYVSRHPEAIGFIGISWIGNPEDTSHHNALKKVRMVALESTMQPGVYVKGSQANIYLKQYPMVRDLIYVLKENYVGLGTAFGWFMGGEQGQLIFRRSYLMPLLKNFGIRPVLLNEK